MKKKEICFFVLVFWGLVICTLLSAGIEKQMTAQAVVVKSDGQPESKLPVDSLVSDDNGSHLYKVVEGEGWESGNRVQEVSPNEYRVEKDNIIMTTGQGQEYIRYVSKPIASGNLIQGFSQYQGQEDNYLVIGLADTVMPVELWEDVTVVERNEKVLLLSMAGQQPYMEAQVRSALSIPEENQIYSLGDVNLFFENMPLIATLLVLIIVSVILWGYSCILAHSTRENRLLLGVNLVIGLVLLGIVEKVTHVIHLPSSLLPGKNILELKYYINEFSKLFRALDGFSDIAAREVFESLKRNMLLSAGVILLGLICCMVILLQERRMVKRNRCRTQMERP